MLIVRHAPSTWNTEGRWQGRADPPLSAAGAALARAASNRVGQVDLVVTSGLSRAVQTAQLLAPGAQEVVVDDLVEYDIGDWSGLTRDTIAQRWPAELAAFDAGRLDRPPGGESREAFDRRVEAAVSVIVEVIGTYEPESVLVVTHAGVVRAVCRLRDAPDRHVGHLCGFEASVRGRDLALDRPVCLGDQADADEGRSEPQAL